jgi:hypothetical protein
VLVKVIVPVIVAPLKSYDPTVVNRTVALLTLGEYTPVVDLTTIPDNVHDAVALFANEIVPVVDSVLNFDPTASDDELMVIVLVAVLIANALTAAASTRMLRGPKSSNVPLAAIG